MLNVPMDILTAHPIRKTAEQKAAFRADLLAYLQELDYESTVETGKNDIQNIIIGDPEKAEYLVTAHYDTPSTIGIPNVCTPCNGFLTTIRYLGSVAFGAASSAGSALLIKSGYTIPGVLLIVFLVGFLYLLRNGPANENNANDNTSGVVTVLEIAKTMPAAHRNKVCFVLFDQEERGTKGSIAYRRKHKDATERQLVLNLDCVGDGDHILFLPGKKVRKDPVLMRKLKWLGGWFGPKQILIVDKGHCSYNSDHKNFPMAVGIGAFQKKKGVGYVLDKIHTRRDTNLEITNVNLLRAALISLICGNAVK